MFRLTLAGPDTHVASSLCATCPHAAAGCCVAPPRYDWADIARVVSHGGRDWLLAQIAAKRLTPAAHGLTPRRVKARVSPAQGSPRLAKCVFHEGGAGCTIPETRRPATCNYYVCEDVLKDAEREGETAAAACTRRAHEALVQRFIEWDQALAEYVGGAHPEGPPFDGPFLDDLAAVFGKLVGGGEQSSRQ